IVVTRKLFVSRSQPLVRWLDIFRNTSQQEQSFAANLTTGFQPFEVLTTGTGDQDLDRDDEFLIVKLATANVTYYVGQYFWSPQAALKPASSTVENGFESVLYAFKVPARGQVALLQLATLSKDLTEVEATLESFKKSSPSVLTGLTEDEVKILANYWV